MTVRLMCLAVLLVALALRVTAQEAANAPADPVLSAFGKGSGPVHEGGTFRLLDAARTPGQCNAVAFAASGTGARESLTLRCKLRVLEGGDGGGFAFLPVAQYGARGPAPFVANWAEPSLKGAFAVGLDVHNPPPPKDNRNELWFGPWGNYENLPQREVSLHFNGRELVKRVAPEEFRGDFAACEISLVHVGGGAEVTVKLGKGTVYDRYFVPGLLPHEARLAMGASTRHDATTCFDVQELTLVAGPAARRARPPVHVEVFNHVLTNDARTTFAQEVDLPPAGWAYSRVILTLDIHDAGPNWDEWDRCGEIWVYDSEGNKHLIVPFITSYRTVCHWEVDVTHFRPWLAGRTKLEVMCGSGFYMNRGFMISVSLDFHHGANELEVARIVPLWNGWAKHGALDNHFQDFFKPQSVAIEKDVAAARIFVTTTGHSQVGEFTPSRRTVAVKADAEAAPQKFENLLWKRDCYLNPNRPQFGTWKFARAGWAPGDIVHPWWIDLGASLVPGKTAEFTYTPHAYEFEEEKPDEGEITQASQCVQAYLLLYRKAGDRPPAPTLLVLGVVEGGLAAKAGLKKGDYLLSYDGALLDTRDDLVAAVAKAEATEGKKTAKLVAYRGAEKLELEVPVGRLGVTVSG